jgi:hypothetical protein
VHDGRIALTAIYADVVLSPLCCEGSAQLHDTGCRRVVAGLLLRVVYDCAAHAGDEYD